MSIEAGHIRPFLQLPAVEVLDLSGSKIDEGVWSEVAELSKLKSVIAKDAKVGPIGTKWLQDHSAEAGKGK
jgi:hypothetical protein